MREDAQSHKRLKRSVLTEKFVETLVIIDSLMFKEFEYQKKDVEFYILTVFNMVLISNIVLFKFEKIKIKSTIYLRSQEYLSIQRSEHQ